MAKTGRERLQEYISRTGLQQREMAVALKITDAFMSQILSGRRLPGWLTAERIEAVCGIPMSSWMPNRRSRTKARMKAGAASDVLNRG